MNKLILVACALSTIAAAPAYAQSVVAWPTEIADQFTPDPGAALRQPDGASTALGDYHYVWLRNFSNVTKYPEDLGVVLGLAPGELSNWDIIAFEENAGAPASGGGWESSIWFFTDQQHAAAAAFDESAAAANPPDAGIVFRTGSIPGPVFNSLFGARSSSKVVSWILISLPDAIETGSPTFSVWVSGALIGEGSPDADAVGVIRSP